VTTADLAGRVAATRRRLDRAAGEAVSLGREYRRQQGVAAAATSNAELYELANAVLTSVADEEQARVVLALEQLVTRGLQVVFDDSLSFHVVTSVRSSRAEVDFVVRTTLPDADPIDTPVIDARGGGLAAVVGFMMRVVVVLLTPGARRLFVLDESFGNVSAEYEGRLAEFIRQLCERAGVQVILVTHSDAYSDFADRHYRLELDASARTVCRQA
jgi:hypothetical protein